MSHWNDPGQSTAYIAPQTTAITAYLLLGPARLLAHKCRGNVPGIGETLHCKQDFNIFAGGPICRARHEAAVAKDHVRTYAKTTGQLPTPTFKPQLEACILYRIGPRTLEACKCWGCFHACQHHTRKSQHDNPIEKDFHRSEGTDGSGASGYAKTPKRWNEPLCLGCSELLEWLWTMDHNMPMPNKSARHVLVVTLWFIYDSYVIYYPLYSFVIPCVNYTMSTLLGFRISKLFLECMRERLSGQLLAAKECQHLPKLEITWNCWWPVGPSV